MTVPCRSLLGWLEMLELRWSGYCATGVFDRFVEFTLSLNGLTERLRQQNLPGLACASADLEKRALSLLNDHAATPVPDELLECLGQQLETFLQVLRAHVAPATAARRLADRVDLADDDPGCQRDVLIIARVGHPWAKILEEQLFHYGFHPHLLRWDEAPTAVDAPLAAIFIPDEEDQAYSAVDLAAVQRLRSTHVSCYIYCLAVPGALEAIVALQRAGANVCVPARLKLEDTISRILDLVARHEQETHRVLIVEDSRTAVADIQRALNLHEIDSRAIASPGSLLQVTAEYRPHAILMDMNMPGCSGEEATRALRQVPEYQSLPVIYLSAESDIAQQVEALRLGGDQFLTKPVNRILLGAVVKTKIERYREMVYSGRHDSLTGVLNHSAAKEMLNQILPRDADAQSLVVAMIDIDRFKFINDTFGHPVGDEVIRSLAWLLRGRLRSSDLIGRYGGEEFLVALSGVDVEQAMALLNRIRQDFSTLPHAHGKSGPIHATFSCGLACMPGYLNAGDVIEAADQALLQAKRSGRNRIVAAERQAL